MPKYIFFKCNDKFRITTNKFNIKMWFIKWIKKNNKFPFDLEFFKNPNNSFQLGYYLDSLNLNPKFKSLNKKISEFIADYGLIAFSLLDLNNPKHLNRASILADKANGYIYNKELEEQFDQRYMIATNDLEDEEKCDEDYQI